MTRTRNEIESTLQSASGFILPVDSGEVLSLIQIELLLDIREALNEQNRLLSGNAEHVKRQTLTNNTLKELIEQTRKRLTK